MQLPLIVAYYEVFAVGCLAQPPLFSRSGGSPASNRNRSDSVEDARAKRLKLNSLVHYNSAIASLSAALRTDASGFDPDGPLPEDIPETNTSKTVQDGVLKLAREENLTVRQLAQRFRGHSRLAFIRTPETVADEPETRLDAVVERLVVPELQRRGIVRREYEGTTLREHLGLPRPQNQFFS
ncbi:hypothetical protein MPDQ_000739 [Monascus purpureus]|uniref:Uncharacterized protein n=1 Tax=Monascus purpureus TaxID=5098 RepID=A0A507QT59_MONPU|nr:hypothetical protein MPDQ_000739 [Monascus purpureus]